MMLNLSKLILKYKEKIISILNDYLNFIDIENYNKLLSKIDELINYISGKNQKEKSIVEMLNDYINT